MNKANLFDYLHNLFNAQSDVELKNSSNFW